MHLHFMGWGEQGKIFDFNNFCSLIDKRVFNKKSNSDFIYQGCSFESCIGCDWGFR